MTRLALCIGINYPGTGFELAGCVNDANDWAAELERRGYEVSIMLDREATRQAILDALSDLVDSLEYKDRLVITYSGHGTYVPDRDGDEADRRDEAICPMDLRSAGVITDDTLYEQFSKAPYGSRVLMVADSCYSGTLQRFAPPISAISTASVAGIAGEWRRVRFLPPAAWTDDVTDPAWQRAAAVPPSGKMRRGALVMSACSDTETAYDARVDGRPCGIYSHVAIAALKTLPGNSTYRQWQRLIRARLPSVDYPEATPQLDGTSTQRRWESVD